jgi:hypothetical protein
MPTPERGFCNRAFWRVTPLVLPLPLALYTNRRYLRGRPNVPTLATHEEWTSQEADALLERSEQRLQSIESKGPGLATVCAIVAAPIVVAISLTWSDTTLGGKILLVFAAFYSLLSLWAPIQLVGPVSRGTITTDTLQEALEAEDSTEFLGQAKAQAAADNDRTTLRLSNLLAASRNDVAYAVLLLIAWSIVALLGGTHA